MIKATIFDFAGVIGTDGYWVWLREIVPNLDERRTFFAELADKVDKGLIDNSINIETLAKETGVSKDQVWEQIYRKILINSELVKYIKELKKKYQMGLLSNFTYPWLEDLLKRHRLAQLFDAVVISSRHKVLKPEPTAFQKILDSLNVSAEEAVFIDDRQVHVDGANKVGIKGLLYTTNEKLKMDLKDFDIKYDTN